MYALKYQTDNLLVLIKSPLPPASKIEFLGRYLKDAPLEPLVE